MHVATHTDMFRHVFLRHEYLALLTTVKEDAESLLTAKGMRVRTLSHPRHFQRIIVSNLDFCIHRLMRLLCLLAKVMQSFGKSNEERKEFPSHLTMLLFKLV